MKFHLISIFAFGLIVINPIIGQTLLTPFGASILTNSGSVCYSGGEAIVTTLSTSDGVFYITQGFQQPEKQEAINLNIINGIVHDDPDNNRFVVEGLEKYPNNSVTILNRWGNIVHEASPYQNDWDGTHDGNQLPAATYYYILFLDDAKTKEIHGNVYILNP